MEENKTLVGTTNTETTAHFLDWLSAPGKDQRDVP